MATTAAISQISLIKNKIGLVLSSIIAALLILLATALLAAPFLVQPSLTQAQTDPISYQTEVSATMPDIVAPSTPVLISPENNAIVSTNQPEFIWMASTDNVEMSHYQLWIDGQLYLNNLADEGLFPDYNLSYDPITTYYQLKLKSNLEEGYHTWKIVAVDAVDNSSDSVTWTFNVDSIATSFVITQIGDQEVSISAKDASTIPKKPIELEDNEPLIIASGEPLSTVDLSVIIPKQDNLEISLNIDGNGDWQYQLPILPRDTIITLNFIIIDKANHVLALDNIKILIKSKQIILPPPTATPTATPAQVGPIKPKASLAPGEPSPTPASIPAPTTKPIKIPYEPPKETIHQIIKTFAPPQLLRIAKIPWVKQLIELWGPWLTVLFMLSGPIMATFLIAKEFGSKLSWSILRRIWQVLGLWPKILPTVKNQAYQRQGLAFDQEHLIGIPFAQITFVSQPDNQYYPPQIETTLTDAQGLYPPLELSPAEYRASLKHEDYRFPTNQTRPEYLKPADFYKGEKIKNDQTYGLSLFIAADNLGLERNNSQSVQNKPCYSNLTRIKLNLNKFCHQQGVFYWSLLSLSGIITLFFPSPVNLLVIILNSLGLAGKTLNRIRPKMISGIVVNKQGDPVSSAFVRASDQTKPQRQYVTMSNDQGRFELAIPAEQYQLEVVRPGYTSAAFSKQLSEQLSGQPLGQLINASRHTQRTVIMLLQA